jgi:single-strand DNA-binding protein
MQNLAILSGNIGQDPETRHTQGGTSVTSFTLATSRNWKDEAGERKQQTEWHRITVFGKNGENVAKYCKKGSKVSVQGRIHYSEYTDRDGNKKYATEIIADEVYFLDSAKREPATGGTKGEPTMSEKATAEDTVPF